AEKVKDDHVDQADNAPVEPALAPDAPGRHRSCREHAYDCNYHHDWRDQALREVQVCQYQRKKQKCRYRNDIGSQKAFQEQERIERVVFFLPDAGIFPWRHGITPGHADFTLYIYYMRSGDRTVGTEASLRKMSIKGKIPSWCYNGIIFLVSLQAVMTISFRSALYLPLLPIFSDLSWPSPPRSRWSLRHLLC